MRIVVFVSLLVMFCIVALTASWTDKGLDEQIDYSGRGINESGIESVSTQSTNNQFDENKSGPDTAYNNRPGDTDEPELATAFAHYRVNYHRSDPNDLKGPYNRNDYEARNDYDTSENDSEDADDIVE